MDTHSFYYRDTIDLKALYPQAYDFSLLYPHDNIFIKDGVMGLCNPEKFDPSRIHNIVRVYTCKYDYFKIEVNIRCWIEGEMQLKEVTRFKSIKTNRVYKLLRRIVNKIHPLPFNTLLATYGDVSYFSHNNKLLKVTEGGRSVVGNMPRLEDPIYYQFLQVGEEAFLRTGGTIYMSSGKMTSWSPIYKGKRAIKDSMVWVECERALLFIEYSPGLNLTRHHVYKYYVDSEELKTIVTFHTPDEHFTEGLSPYCRHIHVLMLDPYTGDIYLGTGDSDDESAIYRSVDNGNTFEMVGAGSQKWRTLSFMFTESHVLWNTDSPDPQYINAISREQLGTLPIETDLVQHYPIYGGSNWNTIYDVPNDLYLMSASHEGALYDELCRIYGISIKEGIPIVNCLFEDEDCKVKTLTWRYQIFLLGIDNKGIYWFFDTRRRMYRQFEMIK